MCVYRSLGKTYNRRFVCIIYIRRTNCLQFSSFPTRSAQKHPFQTMTIHPSTAEQFIYHALKTNSNTTNKNYNNTKNNNNIRRKQKGGGHTNVSVHSWITVVNLTQMRIHKIVLLLLLLSLLNVVIVCHCLRYIYIRVRHPPPPLVQASRYFVFPLCFYRFMHVP